MSPEFSRASESSLNLRVNPLNLRVNPLNLRVNPLNLRVNPLNLRVNQCFARRKEKRTVPRVPASMSGFICLTALDASRCLSLSLRDLNPTLFQLVSLGSMDPCSTATYKEPFFTLKCAPTCSTSHRLFYENDSWLSTLSSQT